MDPTCANGGFCYIRGPTSRHYPAIQIGTLMRNRLLSLIGASLLCGCAVTGDSPAPKEEKSFVTGSNIPRRDTSGYGVEVAGPEALAAQQRASGGPTSRGSEGPPTR